MPKTYLDSTPTQHQRISNLARDDAWISDFLRTALIGHVAHSQNNQPFVTPTIFWFDKTNHRLIFHSNINGRIRFNFEQNPRACLETSEYGHFLPANTALEFSLQYRSAMAFGQVAILQNEEEKFSVLTELLKKYFPHLTPGQEYRPITKQEISRTTVFSLAIESWSGKENWEFQAEELPDWPPLPDSIKNLGRDNRV